MCRVQEADSYSPRIGIMGEVNLFEGNLCYVLVSEEVGNVFLRQPRRLSHFHKVTPLIHAPYPIGAMIASHVGFR